MTYSAVTVNIRPPPDRDRAPLLMRIAPGVRRLRHYRFGDDIRHDAIAGICVASVAVPVAIAYARLAGFRPEVGLYSSVLPLIAYAPPLRRPEAGSPQPHRTPVTRGPV